MPSTQRILIVEDEALIALALKIELTREGFDVCAIAARGEEAVILASKHHPTLILMDIRLAGEMDGFGAAEQILATEDIAIVFLSGYLDESSSARMKRFPRSGSLGKPVSVYELRKVMDSI